MKKVIILIPLNYNDGKPVTAATFVKFQKELLRIAGGYTKDGLVEGEWRDEKSGAEYYDRSRRYIIVTDKVNELKALVLKAGKELKQLEMYFETQDVNIEFLKVK